jgi:peptidoglycan/LPS O-acetylase OafA/YrhL
MDSEKLTERAPGAPQLTRMPALDGVRALAVLAVMAYHNGFSWIPGGYYGVDAFFVLSGFLITSLLLTEVEATGTLKLLRFWGRRARRLLPALFVLVAALGVVHLLSPSLLPWGDPVPDAAATVGYVANWHFVAGDTGYFAASGSLSPLLHTWSLAIEEQFYLVWPLVVLAVMGRRGRHVGAARRQRLYLLGTICVVGAAASVVWMWHLAPVGSSPNRAYYGTDTRAQAVLIGASVAVALALFVTRSARTRRLGAVVGALGVVASAAVWHLVTEGSALAFHGGFLLASLSAAAVVAGVALSPTAPTSRFLALRPLRYVGSVSYGAYLWYWPVLLVLTGSRLHLGQWPLFFVRTGVTVGLAALSYHLVEAPIRRGAFPGWRALLGAPAAAGLSVAVVACSTLFLSPAASTSPPPSAATQRIAAKPTGSEVRVLLVGDSMAGSLGATLATEAPRYGIQLVNEGHPGCAVTTDSEFRFLLYRNPPGPPCKEGDPSALLDLWRQYVKQYRPQVVVYLARTDLFDQDYRGSWTSIGSPSFDRFFVSQLTTGVHILSSGGAHVVLATSPYYDSTIDSASPPVPEDTPGRVSDYNRLLRQVASASRGTSIYPLARLIDPQHTYAGTVDGVAMRCSDGVHFSVTAGKVIAPGLLPDLARLGRHTQLASSVAPRATALTLPASVPSWYDKLQCGQ